MQEIMTSKSNEIVLYDKQLNKSMLLDFINFIDASDNTVKTYARGVRQLYEYLSIKNIMQPKRADLISFREDLKINHKATTVQNYMVAVKLFFKWLSSENLYPNIAENLKGVKLSKEHKKDYLTSKQTKILLSSIDTSTIKGKRDYAIVSLMLTGGLRDMEIVNANVEDLKTLGDFTVLYVLGKGRNEKTDYVKIVEKVETSIRDYLKTREVIFGNEPLFCSLSNNNSGGRMTTRSISRICKNLLIEAGYNSDRLTAHSLGHTAVTLSLIGGKTLQETQEFARHKNITTTQIYAHNLDRAKNNCEEVIANAIF